MDKKTVLVGTACVLLGGLIGFGIGSRRKKLLVEAAHKAGAEGKPIAVAA